MQCVRIFAQIGLSRFTEFSMIPRFHCLNDTVESVLSLQHARSAARRVDCVKLKVSEAERLGDDDCELAMAHKARPSLPRPAPFTFASTLAANSLFRYDNNWFLHIEDPRLDSKKKQIAKSAPAPSHQRCATENKRHACARQEPPTNVGGSNPTSPFHPRRRCRSYHGPPPSQFEGLSSAGLRSCLRRSTTLPSAGRDRCQRRTIWLRGASVDWPYQPPDDDDHIWPGRRPLQAPPHAAGGRAASEAQRQRRCRDRGVLPNAPGRPTVASTVGRVGFVRPDP